MTSPFNDQLAVLLKFSLLRKQEALSNELRVAASTISTWKKRGLPSDKRVKMAEAFGISPAWFDEPLDRFRALVIGRFKPVNLRNHGEESPFIYFLSAQRVAVPNHWHQRPLLKINSEHVLIIDVPSIVRYYGPVLKEIVVLAVGVRGTVLLRPSRSSQEAVDAGSKLCVPDNEQYLRMDAIGSEQFVLAICLPTFLPEDLHQQLMRSAENYIEDANLVPLWDLIQVLTGPTVFLKHTVDVIE